MGFDTNDPGVNTVQQDDLDTPFSDLAAVYGSPVPVGSSTDLELEQGQSLVDGVGTERLKVRSGATTLKDNGGQTRVNAVDNGKLQLNANTGESIVFRDGEGGFDAVTYSANSTSPGTLSVDNAAVQLNENGVAGAGLFQGARVDVPPNTPTDIGNDGGGGATFSVVAGDDLSSTDRFLDVVITTGGGVAQVHLSESGPFGSPTRNYIEAGPLKLELTNTSTAYAVDCIQMGQG